MRPFFRFSVISAVAMLSISTTLAQETPSLPIPPVTTGTIELQEIKPTLTVNVTANQSRTFRTKKEIVRVSVSDPSVAEVVVVSANQFILLGKAPGSVSLCIWTK
jgi:Flp pilus assembly secretin CpaC